MLLVLTPIRQIGDHLPIHRGPIQAINIALHAIVACPKLTFDTIKAFFWCIPAGTHLVPKTSPRQRFQDVQNGNSEDVRKI